MRPKSYDKQQQPKENEMNNYNLEEYVKWAKAQPKNTMSGYAGSVGDEVAKVKINHSLSTRAHTFSDGEVGEVADKLTIEIDFSNVAIQPHTDFEGDFGAAIAECLADSVNGAFDNAGD